MPATRRIVRRPSSASAPAAAPEKDYEEEAVDEAPRSRRRNTAAAAPSRGRSAPSGGVGDDEPDEDLSGVLAEGWSGAKRTQAGTGDFAEEFKISDEAQLVKFLQDEPFVSYKQHWIDNIQGKKSWPCIGDDCPLCDIGSTVAAKTCFNVFDMADGKNKILILGTKAVKQLESFAADRKTGPLGRSDMYFGVHKTGQKQQVSYVITPVKERDVQEDWGMEPLSDEEIEKYVKKMYDKKAIPVFGKARLEEVAELAVG